MKTRITPLCINPINTLNHPPKLPKPRFNRIIKFEEEERKMYQKYFTVLNRTANRKAPKYKDQKPIRFISPRITAGKLNRPRLFSDPRGLSNDASKRDNVHSAVRARKDFSNANSFTLKKAPMCIKHKKEDFVSLPDANERVQELKHVPPARALCNRLSSRDRAHQDRFQIKVNDQKPRRANMSMIPTIVPHRKVSEAIQR
mmetsp:Transcript_18377/g.18040  ORF Transcript_18377/g.18040 Transcript_18377/m.18040 type:complete len:201 (+) Transcript_18377:18-620(+)